MTAVNSVDTATLQQVLQLLQSNINDDVAVWGAWRLMMISSITNELKSRGAKLESS